LGNLSIRWTRKAEGATKATPLAHRLDEFPVGYSWRVALQHGPLLLYQPRQIVEKTVTNRKNYFLIWTTGEAAA